MKNLLSIGLICAMLVPSSAMALEAGVPRQVWIMSHHVGTITPTLLGGYHRGLDYCPYRGVWVGPSGVGSLELEFREHKAFNYMDCRANALTDFDTVTILAAPSLGYGLRGELRDIDSIAFSRSRRGDFTGTLLYAGVRLPMPFRLRW